MDAPEIHQSPVEKVLDVLAQFRVSDDPTIVEEVSFLQSTLYALQQNGIDDTSVIPPYLLSDYYQQKSPSSQPPSLVHSFRSSLDEVAVDSPRLDDPEGNQGDETERAVKNWLLSTYCRNIVPESNHHSSLPSPRSIPSKSKNKQPNSSNGYLADEGDIVVTDECAKALSLRHKWKFNILEAKRTSPNFGFLLVSCIFEDWGIFKTLRIDKKILRRFVQKISLGYHPNPYHNFTHALDVFQTLHCLLRAVAPRTFTTDEIFALLTAALIHDLGHDGFNNSFHIRSFSQRAVDHNDGSPQENYHLTKAFSIINKEEFNFLSVFDSAAKAKIREFIIHVVLHTDMSHHFELESQIKTFLNSQGEQALGESKDSKKLLGAILLHMADISNPAKSFGLAKYWACNSMEELYTQGSKERDLEFPVSPMCDPLTAPSVPASQMGFINFIVLPLYTVMRRVVPSLIDEPLNALNDNLLRWRRFDGKGVQEMIKSGILPISAFPSLEKASPKRKEAERSDEVENCVDKKKDSEDKEEEKEEEEN